MTVLSPVAAALAVLTAPAAAQQAPATVAGPTPSGATLTAFDRGGQLCLRVDLPRGGGGGGRECGPPPASAYDVRPAGVGDGERSIFFAAVPPGVASVEARFAGGARAGAPASAGPAYRGRFAGAVRFMLVESPAPVRAQPYRFRFLAADGRVIAAVQPPAARLPTLRPPATFATGRAGGRRWRAVAFVRQELRATPLEPERVERVACVGLAPAALGGLRAETCADEGPLQAAVRSGSDSACRPVGLVLTGLVAPRVARVVAVLGDGRRRAVPVRPLPPSLAVDRRAFALALDRDTALRALVALDRAGRTVANIAFGFAPARLKCNRLPNLGVARLVFAVRAVHGSELAPPPGPPRLLAADDGPRLCFSIGRFGPDGADCDLPPLALFDTRVVRQTTGGRTLVAGVVPAAVQAVRVHLAGGVARVVPTAPTLPGYTGRYAGAVRFFALDTPGAKRAPRVDLLGAGGAQLLSVPGPDVPPPRAPAPLVRTGGARVAVGTFGGGIPCVRVAARSARARSRPRDPRRRDVRAAPARRHVAARPERHRARGAGRRRRDAPRPHPAAAGPARAARSRGRRRASGGRAAVRSSCAAGAAVRRCGASCRCRRPRASAATPATPTAGCSRECEGGRRWDAGRLHPTPPTSSGRRALPAQNGPDP